MLLANRKWEGSILAANAACVRKDFCGYFHQELQVFKYHLEALVNKE
jgi:hypothetical protein